MRLEVFETAGQAAEAAAARLAACLARRPGAVLGLATGATMEAVYAGLVRRVAAGEASLARATSFNLDEYLGLSADDPASYRATMERQLFGLVDLPPARAFLPDGLAADPEAEAARYEAAIAAAGGIDLQLLGLGRNGHVGFNEPGSPAASRTRVVRLAEATRTANARHFAAGRAVPERAITMGIATIREARALLMVVTGTAKRDALRRMQDEAPSPDCPASLLRGQPDLTVLADRAAAGGA